MTVTAAAVVLINTPSLGLPKSNAMDAEKSAVLIVIQLVLCQVAVRVLAEVPLAKTVDVKSESINLFE
jgi:hypothetical protein